jgi:hypothetical protein
LRISSSSDQLEPVVDTPFEPEEPIARNDEPAAHPSRIRPTDRAVREFFDLDFSGEGPASLLAAVAALEAEEHNSFSASTSPPDDESVDEAIADDAHANQAVVMTPAGPQFIDLSSLLDPATTSADPVSTTDGGDHTTDVYEIDATVLDPAFGESTDGPIGDSADAPVSEPTSLLASLSDLDAIFKTAPEFRSAAPAPQPAPAPLENLKEWEYIVEALRRDAERLEARPPAPSQLAPVESVEDQQSVTPSPTIPPAQEIDSVHTEAQPAAAVADPAQSEVAAEPATTKARRKRAKAVPPQDEWGFFDPDQCGFAALIEKLEEVTDKDDKPAPRGA